MDRISSMFTRNSQVGRSKLALENQMNGCVRLSMAMAFCFTKIPSRGNRIAEASVADPRISKVNRNVCSSVTSVQSETWHPGD